MPVHFLRRLTAATLLLASTTAVSAEGLAGSYLAGRVAIEDSDFAQASQYFQRALKRDPQNPVLMESLVYSQIAMGDVAAAAPVARQMQADGLSSQVANIVVMSDAALKGDYAELLALLDAQQGVSPPVDGLLKGWAYLGQGNLDAALSQFDEVARQDERARLFAHYHKALALASEGQLDAAEAIFSADNGSVGRLSRRAAMGWVEVLSQLGRNEDALALMAEIFRGGLDPSLEQMVAALSAGETLPFTIAPSARDGLAEVFFVFGGALNGELRGHFVLVLARAAAALRPDHVDAILLSAQLLDQMGRYELSIDTYKTVPRGHPDFHAAELGRAEALRRAAKPNAAAEVLEQLARDFPDQIAVFVDLGDLMRQQENYAAAAEAYDRALELSPEGASNRWFLLYARGICHERLKDWDKAEADFRAALALNPDQAQVLNYLGYSLVERREKLDEALDMIERAVAERPDSGYIVDSLGWVLYRLGRYGEAVGHMERAVELMPVDPVVNDHLGDVYWAVGRKLEAQFQWKRALSFIDPEDKESEADPDRIRRKLEAGLDVVLEEEGAAPLTVANDG